jgi:DNA-directed RNA polymerase specialized sigma24 family protein
MMSAATGSSLKVSGSNALQNAYLLVYRGISKFREEAGLSTWLVRVVINEALGFLRKRSRSAHVINLEGSELDAACFGRFRHRHFLERPQYKHSAIR